jgi:hypothetical protein
MKEDGKVGHIVRFMHAINASQTFVSEVIFNPNPLFSIVERESEQGSDEKEMTVDASVKVYVYKPVEYLGPNHTAVLFFYSDGTESVVNVKRAVLREEDLAPRQKIILRGGGKASLLDLMARKPRKTPFPMKNESGQAIPMRVTSTVVNAYIVNPVHTKYDHPAEINWKGDEDILTILYLRYLQLNEASGSIYADREKQITEKMSLQLLLHTLSKTPVTPFLLNATASDQQYLMDWISNITFD